MTPYRFFPDLLRKREQFAPLPIVYLPEIRGFISVATSYELL